MNVMSIKQILFHFPGEASICLFYYLLCKIVLKAINMLCRRGFVTMRYKINESTMNFIGKFTSQGERSGIGLSIHILSI